MRGKNVTLPVPILGLIAGTRGLLGAGIGLLLASRLTDDKRQRVGKVLLAIGIASTAPLLWRVLRRQDGSDARA